MSQMSQMVDPKMEWPGKGKGKSIDDFTEGDGNVLGRVGDESGVL